MDTWEHVMSSYSLAFQLGAMYGFAIGVCTEQRKPNKVQPAGRYSEDELILRYVNRRTEVYIDDVIGYLNWDDDRSSRITVGNAMVRIGWQRRRQGAAKGRRWYYVRGAHALAHGEPTPQA